MVVAEAAHTAVEVAAVVPTVAEAVTAAATTNSDFETQPGEARINSGPLPYATPNVSCFSATPDSATPNVGADHAAPQPARPKESCSHSAFLSVSRIPVH